MRLRTGLVVVGLFTVLAALVVFGVGLSPTGGALEERWVSDTVRDNQVNHHAVGVGPDGDVVVAPVAEVPHSDVQITNSSCQVVRLAPGNGSVLWRDGVPAADCFTHALTEPAIEDVDDDGRLEVVYASTENALVVADARTGNETFRVPLASYGYSRPTVADVRPSPGPELVTSDMHGNVVVADANGTVAWRSVLNGTFDSRVTVQHSPVVDDVDADGSVEVVVGTRAGPAILSSTGRIEWSGENGATYLAVGQVDDDPAREIVTSADGSLQAIDGATRERQWQLSMDENARLRTVTDVDDDGTVELFVGLTNGTAVTIDAGTGAREWTTTVSSADNGVLSSPVLADVDGEGTREVVTVSRDGTVAVLDAASGTELAAYERSVPIWTVPTAADVNDDGSAEILVRYGDGRVVALEFETA